MTLVHLAEANPLCNNFTGPARPGQAGFGSSAEADLVRQLFESEAVRRRSREVWVPARRDLAREGQAPERVSLLLDGWAVRYKQLKDGRRQVLSLILPGELCDAYVSRAGELDHAIATVTPVRVCYIGRADFDELLDARPAVARAVWQRDLVREAVQRELLLSLGRRTAKERVAHLFAETFLRLQALGRSRGQECDFPLTQSDIAEVLGMSAVHVNRTLQDLRREGLVQLRHRRLSLPSPHALMRLAHLDPQYLQLPVAPNGAERAQMVR